MSRPPNGRIQTTAAVTAEHSFKPLLKTAGLPDIKFHELRHTCATIRFMKGQHPKVVQELLGHKSIAITLDIYSHVISGMGSNDAMKDALS